MRILRKALWQGPLGFGSKEGRPPADHSGDRARLSFGWSCTVSGLIVHCARSKVGHIRQKRTSRRGLSFSDSTGTRSLRTKSENTFPILFPFSFSRSRTNLRILDRLDEILTCRKNQLMVGCCFTLFQGFRMFSDVSYDKTSRASEPKTAVFTRQRKLSVAPVSSRKPSRLDILVLGTWASYIMFLSLSW